MSNYINKETKISDSDITLKDLSYDSGWIDIPLENGFKAIADWAKPQARRIGKLIYLRGSVKGFGVINFTKFATLPATFLSAEDRGIQFTVSVLNEASLKAVMNINLASGELTMTTAEGDIQVTHGININCSYCI